MDILLPAGGSGPGVVVGHAWWGLNSALRDYGARLAAAGFVVALPDLFDGRVARSIAEAVTLVSRDWDADAKLSRAVTTLSRHDAVRGGRVGTIGFSYSGWALVGLASDRSLPISGTVVYYASRIPAAGHGPILAHLAEHDPFESDESMDEMAAALSRAGAPNAAHRYAGTMHWFAEADRSEYAAAAAELAFERTLGFLRSQLVA